MGIIIIIIRKYCCHESSELIMPFWSDCQILVFNHFWLRPQQSIERPNTKNRTIFHSVSGITNLWHQYYMSILPNISSTLFWLNKTAKGGNPIAIPNISLLAEPHLQFWQKAVHWKVSCSSWPAQEYKRSIQFLCAFIHLLEKGIFFDESQVCFRSKWQKFTDLQNPICFSFVLLILGRFFGVRAHGDR